MQIQDTSKHSVFVRNEAEVRVYQQAGMPTLCEVLRWLQPAKPKVWQSMLAEQRALADALQCVEDACVQLGRKRGSTFAALRQYLCMLPAMPMAGAVLPKQVSGRRLAQREFHVLALVVLCAHTKRLRQLSETHEGDEHTRDLRAQQCGLTCYADVPSASVDNTEWAEGWFEVLLLHADTTDSRVAMQWLREADDDFRYEVRGKLSR